MTQTTTGWVMFLAGLGTILTLLVGDIASLKNWSDATYPSFVAGVIAHIGSVLTAFAGGKMIPTNGEKK